MSDSTVVDIFSGNCHWNDRQWRLSWETKDGIGSLEFLIPRKSDDWKEDWVDLVTQGFPGFTNYAPVNYSKSSQSVTLVDQIPLQEILCNTILTCVNPQNPDRAIVSKIADHYAEEVIVDILQSLADDDQVRHIRMDFYAGLLEPGNSCKVFKSERERLRFESFNRGILVTDQAIAPWRV
jgi:hypothetical protein